MSSDVLAIKPLTSSGRVQGYIGTGAGTATNLGPIRNLDQEPMNLLIITYQEMVLNLTLVLILH